MSWSDARWMAAFWRPWRWLLIPIALCTVLNGWLVAALPLAIKHVFDVLEKPFTPEILWPAVVSVAVVGFGRFLVYCSLQNMRAWMIVRLEWAMRSHMFRHLQRLGPRGFARFTTGDMLTRLSDDVGDQKLAWFLSAGTLRVAEALCIAAGVGIAMMRLHPTLAAIALMPLPVVLVLLRRKSASLAGHYAKLQGSISAANAELESSLHGVRVVKAYTMEAVRRQAFEERVDERAKAEMVAVRAQAGLEVWFGFVWQVTAAMMLLLSGALVIRGILTLGDCIAFNGLALSMTIPLLDVNNFVTRGRQALACMARLREMEAVEPEVQERESASSWLEPSVIAAGLTYSYLPDGPAALQDVALSVEAGHMVAITGPVGGGKSTLLRLLMRLTEADAGTVQRGGQDLRLVSLDAARGGLGYVSQEPILISGTVVDNVRFGRPEVQDADVRMALRIARLESELDPLQDVGVRGGALSGGQKQRLSLARAIAGRPALLLLDDCAASLDAENEAGLWEALRRELPATTIVAVTHRPAMLERANDVIVLDSGQASRAADSPEASSTSVAAPTD